MKSHPLKVNKDMIDCAMNEAQKNLDAGIEPQIFDVVPGYFFMVGEYVLDINQINLVYSGCQSGLVPNYESKQDAYKAAQAMCDEILGVTYA